MKLNKLLVLVLVLAMVAALCVGLTACKGDDSDEPQELTLAPYDVVNEDLSGITIPADFKIGMICLHDKSSTYDKNFIEAMEAVQAELGLSNDQVILATGIPESDACYQKACELADQGCDIIFADSFGHEAYMIQAAKKYPEILFAHATGTKAHTENLPNYVNAFASIYEGRFLAGVAAGLKLKEMIDNGTIKAEEAKMGYVGAYTYAEVISGYSSFYLGAKSVCPSVTMEVTFTGSWYDETAENNAATMLINNGCKLISQHADSMGAPNACEEAGVPNVSYNGSTFAACSNTFIVSSKINWAPYYKHIIKNTIAGTPVEKDWTGTIKTGSVVLTNVGGGAAAEGTVEKIIEVRNQLANGTLEVFDCSKFTVEGKNLTTYTADVDDMGDYVAETEVIENGIFKESKFRSAPYFDLTIDGITLLNKNFG